MRARQHLPRAMSAGRAVAAGVAIVAVGLAVVLLTGGSKEGPDAAGVRTVPASIAADCSRNVQDELSRFIAGVPDGVTVRFRPGGCYAADGRIEVRDKTGLTIDGNGSTFRSSSQNTGKGEANPNWLLLRGRDLVITDMKIAGNFDLTGVRSQQRVNQASTEGEAGATSQPNAGIGIYGGSGISVHDVEIRGVFGDGILTGVSEYVDAGVPSQTPRDVDVERVVVTKAARHCFSPNQVVGFRLEDSVGRDCWYGALDAELDDPTQQLQDVHIVANTFAGFNLLGIFVPVAGDGENTRDIEIRDNTFLTPPDQPCNTIIEVGAYPKSRNTIRNVVVEDNTMKASGVGVALDHVRGGRIRANRIDYSEKGCARPLMPPPVRLTNSSGVTVEDNERTSAPG
jgi:hypothetical protein